MRYYVETEVTVNRNSERITQKRYYNYTKDTWQVKLTEQCKTSDHETASRILMLRLFVTRNTSIYITD